MSLFYVKALGPYHQGADMVLKSPLISNVNACLVFSVFCTLEASSIYQLTQGLAHDPRRWVLLSPHFTEEKTETQRGKAVSRS